MNPVSQGLLPPERSYFWASLQGPGMEQLRIRLDPVENVAHSLVMGIEDGLPYRLHYKIKWGSDWRIRKLALESHTTDGMRERIFKSDGRGHWRDDQGEPQPELDGCIDVDIAVTPFTNSFPVRRLELAPGQSQEIRVLYVSVPGLAVKPVTQRYTCREQANGRHKVTYEGYPAGFSADLELDRDGLVIDYPDLFRRVAPR
ncbi:MAG TPA: putative glycolipid-binding domain-containing protein [Hypericibacter adhaerens]|jgi:hypothetical protein|uniref:putative glycolipid-binding domain-containing protein n=1 Tax=Hypericibacter adhaerens TaxID=2602016 RepID=UPI002B54AA20|nr:putative glycolipid-binding domain-containing protein [Hypericibacter adhaerens]HWA41996.1 putative glycolipid-binding domain-containing protein [Hypericibacter adhaerens]